MSDADSQGKVSIEAAVGQEQSLPLVESFPDSLVELVQKSAFFRPIRVLEFSGAPPKAHRARHHGSQELVSGPGLKPALQFAGKLQMLFYLLSERFCPNYLDGQPQAQRTKAP